MSRRTIEGHPSRALGNAAVWPIQCSIHHFGPMLKWRIDDDVKGGAQ